MVSDAFRRRLTIACAVTILFGAVALAAAFYATRWHPARDAYTLQGVDVTGANGVIDWFVVRAQGADFAYVRATIGADRRDTRFADNWAALEAVDMPRGAVHVFSLCSPAAAQAANFVRTVPRTGDALPAALALDFSDDCTARPSRETVIARVTSFLRLTEGHAGKPMLLRLSRQFEKRYRISEIIDRPAWVEGRFFAPDYTARPWRMWRASDVRRIDGVSGTVNWDVIADDR
ncbi:glycosyl hydrolase [Stakelama sp. CBK3Z-3]|uniref:Glycosyl hydrolase n=1 Tax=Stakelama flava TaxID=2860338 RepID=A0ABS6XL19_9SPHN|nr:GH25 family lysozyme [Stakelama flava]MBW4330508.1 glycosyl hydrolase [Stakelama flava]